MNHAFDQPSDDESNGIDVQTSWWLVSQRTEGAAVVAGQGNSVPASFLAPSTTHLTASPPTIMVSINHKTSAVPIVSGLNDARS